MQSGIKEDKCLKKMLMRYHKSGCSCYNFNTFSSIGASEHQLKNDNWSAIVYKQFTKISRYSLHLNVNQPLDFNTNQINFTPISLNLLISLDKPLYVEYYLHWIMHFY